MNMNKTSIFALALVTVLMTLSSGSALATTMYRWTDQNGNPVVSDRPPPKGTAFTEINVNFTPARRRDALRDTPTSESAAADQPSEAGSKVPALCTRARDHIEKLENAPTIATTDGSGNVRVLSDEERAEQLDNARRMAAQHCPET